LGVSQAKAAYAAQMKGVVHEGYNPQGKFNPKNLEEQNYIFEHAKVQELMKSTGLTEGEVLAIRAYTASNYKYINPAIANQKDRKDKNKDWMDTQNLDPSKVDLYLKGSASDAGSKKGLYEEGALHAGMIMEAFKKLPPTKASLYRGSRMNPADFEKAYAVGKEITYEAFVSQTTDPGVARKFANGEGDFPPPVDATTSVFVEASVTDARNVMALSIYSDEKELLVPPGTTLRVEKIEDDTQREDGDPQAPKATAWKKVTLVQVVKKR